MELESDCRPGMGPTHVGPCSGAERVASRAESIDIQIMFLTLHSGWEVRQSVDVASHQILDRLTLTRKVSQPFIDGSDQGLEFREVLVMRRSALHILP